MAEEIIITVPLHGSQTVKVTGVKGKGCRAITAEYEKSLGRRVASEDTREAHEVERTALRNRA